jgi:hypothetical protein
MITDLLPTSGFSEKLMHVHPTNGDRLEPSDVTLWVRLVCIDRRMDRTGVELYIPIYDAGTLGIAHKRHMNGILNGTTR